MNKVTQVVQLEQKIVSDGLKMTARSTICNNVTSV
jgi:hypothetical protein